MMRPDTTIFVLSYNYGHYLAGAVESALGQDEPTRIVVIDDGSTDGTADVAASFGDKVEYWYKPNGGLSDARNFAAARCSSTYLMYLDADDRIPAAFVGTCLAALQANSSVSFVYTQLQRFGASDGLTAFPRYSVERLVRGNFIDSTSVLRTTVVQKFPYDVRLRAGLEDWDFYLTLAESGHYGLLVDGTHVCSRVHAQSMGAGLERNAGSRRRTYARILWKHRRLFGIRGVTAMVRKSASHRLRALQHSRDA